MVLIASILAAAATNVADLRQAVWDDSRIGDAFAVTCTVTAVTKPSQHRNLSCWIMDDTGVGYVRTTNGVSLAAGGLYFLRGHVGSDEYGWHRAFVDTAGRLGDGTMPAPVAATPEQLNDETFDGRTVVMRGVVTDIIRDDIDPDWRFMLIRTDSTPFFAAVSSDDDTTLDRLVGATVAAKGVANVLPDGGKRKFQTPQLTIANISDITVLTPAVDDPRAAPQIPPHPQMSMEHVRYKSVAALSRMGRRRAEGWVIAVFGRGESLLMKTDSGQIVGASLRDPSSPPRYGDRIAAAGFPETDLFIITLEKAIWTRIAEGPPAECPVEALSDDFAMEDVLRRICANGHAVRIRGRVSDTPPPDGQLFTVVFGRHAVKVDASAACAGQDPIEPGSTVEVIGTCVRNTSHWATWNILPRTEGFTVVPRTVADVRVISSPPWWTPGRLLVVVSALALALLAAFVWNRSLRRLAERRSRQLLKSEIAHAEADMRLGERTRLAAEIHDAISQTLTGVSFQIDAAEKTLPVDRDAAAGFLGVARRTLLSCREELRRCIWDLRNDTLAAHDFAEAVRRTVRPGAGGATVAVRFAVIRAQLSDSTAHAVLSIVRELAVNAVRHGKAAHVWIAGEHTGGRIRFSVRDDGCGFDPASRPGPAEGHFGLQGVKERVARLGGSVLVESTPGHGAKVTVELGK